MKDYKITRKKFFDTEERRKLLKFSDDMATADKAKGRMKWQIRWMLVDLAMYSGLRLAEIRDLLIGDLKLNAKSPYLYVRQGKRGKDRDVYIDKDLTKHLRDFIEMKRMWNQPTDDNSPLFTGQKGKHFTTTALTLNFKQAVLQAGLRKDLSIHGARHTYATLLYSKTQNLRYVQKQLGHASMAMTGLYADILPEENGKLADMIIDDADKQPKTKAPTNGQFSKKMKRGTNLKES
ncbi:MAG: tyrosine-type recombinase/integrase [Balneolales bacterium]